MQHISHYENNIPEGWLLVKASEVISLLSGRDLESSRCNSVQEGIPYLIGASNLQNGEISITRWTSTPEVISTKGDILLSCKGTVGEIAENTIGDVHIARQFMALKSKGLDHGYLKLFVEAKVPLLKTAAKGVIPGISRDDILEMLISVPPYAEQIRIAATVSHYMTIIESIHR